MDKLREDDKRQYVCDNCINNCKNKATGCSSWEEATLENKYNRILYMGVGRTGLPDENAVLTQAVRGQLESTPCGSILSDLKKEIKDLDKYHDGIVNIYEVFALIDKKMKTQS